MRQVGGVGALALTSSASTRLHQCHAMLLTWDLMDTQVKRQVLRSEEEARVRAELKPEREAGNFCTNIPTHLAQTEAPNLHQHTHSLCSLLRSGNAHQDTHEASRGREGVT